MKISGNRCRITTKSGERCSRSAELGGMGFCWQHVPIPKESKGRSWEDWIKITGLIVTATGVVLKIAELAIKHLPEYFGPGDEQTEAKKKIMEDFPPFWSRPPDVIVPGARVDWKELLSIYQSARALNASGTSRDDQAVDNLERQFATWFESLDPYHQEQLLRAIEELSESAQNENA
jgi:hypothetical protein